jgi:pimeloyl-ACP methyl ester carboxylesterase
MNSIVRMAAMSLAVMPFAAVAAQVKRTIVLVHGAFETSEVWSHVVTKLGHNGYTVLTIDLAGRGGNNLPFVELSLTSHQQNATQAIAGEPMPVTLVGHSFAGVTISAIADATSDKINTLVYVAAYSPHSGQSLLTLTPPDKNSKLGPLLTISKEKETASVEPLVGDSGFANDAPATVHAMVASAIVDEPLASLAKPITLTPLRLGAMDDVVIHTLRNEVVSSMLQTEMEHKTPVRLDMTINTGRTPFITNRAALAEGIEDAIRESTWLFVSHVS